MAFGIAIARRICQTQPFISTKASAIRLALAWRPQQDAILHVDNGLHSGDQGKCPQENPAQPLLLSLGRRAQASRGH